MADIFSKAKRSEVMSKIRSKNTKPEISVRKFLFLKGFRYRLHKKDLPGNPDLTFKKYSTVIFVHGCFWHGHSCKIGSGQRKPKTNIKYWTKKIQHNIARDRNNRRKLRNMGWDVIIIWECQTRSVKKITNTLQNLIKKQWKQN